MHSTAMTKTARCRNLLVAAVALLVVVLIVIGANGLRIGDVWVGGFLVVGVLMGISLARGLRLERSIVKDACESSATVVRVWHPVLGRGQRMSYEFLAEDGKLYLGSSAATPRPTKGQPVLVVYRRDRPIDNLPKRQFWFYEV